MKLTGVILAAVVLGTTVSVSAEENLLQKMGEANQNIALFENADRVAFRNTMYDAEGNGYSAYSYGDQELVVYEEESGANIQESEALYGLQETDDFQTDITVYSKKTAFSYIHDPRENPHAMKDIVENPDAVYGFSPDPQSDRLGSYAEYDWTDAEVVEAGRQERIAYHESIEDMIVLLKQLREEGKSIEEMARAVSEERNRIRLEAYKDDPEGLKKVKESNLETYGNENGPTADSLYEKYGSWETVLQKAFGTNPGMDACVGLYDDYYDLYEELGVAK